ncbi:MAG: efflux transporter outer membrane subunit [Planctomycetota bacterium]|jgi:NodT family efflux transporter outer membrane factor (OMF) lipoprotein
MSRSITSVSLSLLGFHALLSCAVGPDYVPPEPDVPDQWHVALTDGFAEGSDNIHSWWMELQDEQLNDLIRRAAEGNKTLEIAFSRVKESRAIRGIATGERFPDLDASGFAQRNRLSEGIIGVTIPPLSRTDNIYGLGVDASWELDLWGRISRSIESADAGLQSSVENYRDVLVLLLADVASTYVDVRTFQERIRYLQSNIDNQRGTLQLTQDRANAQIAPELDVRQAELNLARTESALPSLREALARSVHRLGVLLGEHPGQLAGELAESKAIPSPPETVFVGVPREVVRQRPDIRRAERSLAAQTARIGVATANLYPRFSLFGSFAYEAGNDLFESDNQAWSFGPAFRWNLFDGGRLRNNILLEDARTEGALVDYERTVLFALEDVENQVVAFVEEGIRGESLARSATAAQQATELVKTLYRNGLTDFQNVLDTEQALFQQQDALADSQGRRVKNLIGLYRAIGGGWDPDAKMEAEIVDQQEKGEPIF